MKNRTARADSATKRADSATKRADSATKHADSATKHADSATKPYQLLNGIAFNPKPLPTAQFNVCHIDKKLRHISLNAIMPLEELLFGYHWVSQFANAVDLDCHGIAWLQKDGRFASCTDAVWCACEYHCPRRKQCATA
jgi:hypothetical protein